jgi:hypothetical protein
MISAVTELHSSRIECLTDGDVNVIGGFARNVTVDALAWLHVAVVRLENEADELHQ